ncbi:MAG: autotransporter outer membrane beta-barrel domain-containing protein [Burkholderiales bacterium]|jgi:autotransporter family porin|nr:autotransporter outer membrane beta-barrel domain-containing protein [Burkholderiales bacterium]
MSQLYQGFSLVKRMLDTAITVAFAPLMTSKAATAADYKSTIHSTNPHRILQGGDAIAVTGNKHALDAYGPDHGIQVVDGGITATSTDQATVMGSCMGFIDLGTGSTIRANGAGSSLCAIVSGGSGALNPPYTTIIGADLSAEVVSSGNACGFSTDPKGIISMTGNTKINVFSGSKGVGMKSRDSGIISLENAVVKMAGHTDVPQIVIHASLEGAVMATGKVSATATGSHVYGTYAGGENTTITLNNFTADLTGTGSVFGAFIRWGTVSLLGSSDVTISAEANAYGLYADNQSTVSIGTEGSATPNKGVWNITGTNHAAAIRTELHVPSDAGLHDIKIHNTTLNSNHDGIVVSGSRTVVLFDNSTLLVDPISGDLAYVEGKSVEVNDVPTPFGSDLLIDARNASQLSGTVFVDAASRLRISLASDAQWTLAGSTVITDLKLDNGRLVFQAPTTVSDFKTLTVFKNYDATDGGGTIVMNTRLDDGANPATDLLVIEGNTSGTAALNIQNFTGIGALTTGNGIQVVQVNGHSDAVFTLAQPVTVGDYKYALVKANDGHWYLQSSEESSDKPQRLHRHAKAASSTEIRDKMFCFNLN